MGSPQGALTLGEVIKRQKGGTFIRILPFVGSLRLDKLRRRDIEHARDKLLLLVALTGYGDPEQRARAIDAGLDLHIIKPVDAAQLRRLLQRDRQSAAT